MRVIRIAVCVVPLVGTWIEIKVLVKNGYRTVQVVPLVGTWIEIQQMEKH